MSVLFKDSEGREWHVKVTVATVDRILELCGVDLYESEDWGRVLQEPRLACAVLAAVLKPSYEARSLTTEQFRDGLDGDAAASGIEALHEAIANFTQPELRATRVKLVQKLRETVKAQGAVEMARMESGAIDKLIQAELTAVNQKIDQTISDRLAKLSGAISVDSMSIPEN